MCVDLSFAIFPYFGSGFRPAFRSATTIFWFGMMMKKTLADMIVAVNAPRWRSAARPVKTWSYPQAIATSSAKRRSISAVGFSPSGDLQSAS